MEAMSRVFYEKAGGGTEKKTPRGCGVIGYLLLIYGSTDSVMLYVLSLADLPRKEYSR